MYYYVYVLFSENDHMFYTGYTSDLKNRLLQHQFGKVKSTKNRIPLILHYSEQFDNKSDAIKREIFFKSIEGYIWLKENDII